MIVDKKGRHRSLVIAGTDFRVIALATVSVRSESSSGHAPVKARYLPGYTAWGEWPTSSTSSLQRGATP